MVIPRYVDAVLTSKPKKCNKQACLPFTGYHTQIKSDK